MERVRGRIATDLHDDIGSGLSQIAILSEVAIKRGGHQRKRARAAGADRRHIARARRHDERYRLGHQPTLRTARGLDAAYAALCQRYARLARHRLPPVVSRPQPIKRSLVRTSGARCISSSRRA